MSGVSTSQKLMRKCTVCGKPAASTCSRCKSVWYCSKDCQMGHWKVKGHKSVCQHLAAASGCLAPGVATDAKIQTLMSHTDANPVHLVEGPALTLAELGAAFPHGFHESSVLQAAGLSLCIANKPCTPQAGKNNQFFTYLMIDPASGFAGPQFQGGLPDCLVFRKDGQPLSVDEGMFLWNALCNVLDCFGGSRAPDLKEFFQDEQEEHNERALDCGGKKISLF